MCEIINKIKKGEDPFFVKELETGYVVMSWYQFFPGYVLFICKEHVTEIHELDKDFKLKFLNEASLVGEAIFKAFNPRKMNYSALGNSDPHLHWHITPRYNNDPKPENPIWAIPEEIRCSEKAKPTSEELMQLKKKIKEQLDILIN